MKQATVFKYEAFTDIPDLGNPAGIVFNGDDYSDEEMQMIAEMAGYNETSFLCKSGEADLRIRYFTPGHEMNLCGHATVASLYALIEKGRLQADQTYQIETKAGILPAKAAERNGRVYITLEQAPPQFLPFTGDKEKLAASLGITAGFSQRAADCLRINGDLDTDCSAEITSSITEYGAGKRTIPRCFARSSESERSSVFSGNRSSGK